MSKDLKEIEKFLGKPIKASDIEPADDQDEADVEEELAEEIKENVAPPNLKENIMQSSDGTDAMSTMSDISNTVVFPSEVEHLFPR